jgi:hypothetical protein
MIESVFLIFSRERFNFFRNGSGHDMLYRLFIDKVLHRVAG